MRKIALYEDGSKGIIEMEGNNTILINGKEPWKLIEATPENLEKHFGDIEIPQDSKVVV